MPAVKGTFSSFSDILDRLPRVGRAVPELDDDTVREPPPYSYRVIYEIKSEDVVVLAVIHKRRELQPEMIER